LAWRASLSSPSSRPRPEDHADEPRARAVGEKYAEWTDDDLPLDDLLGIATFWWLRDSYPSSIWAYADMQKTGISALHNDPQHRLDKPLGFSSFAKEISSTPEAWASRNANLQWYRYHDKVRLLSLSSPPQA